MHIIITVNASWNVFHFRRSLIAAMLADGHRITIIAPYDEHSSRLIAMGCRFVPLKIDVHGRSPLRDIALFLRFMRHFRREQPDVVLSYTIKNNIFGALAAGALKIPCFPNITGLGTAFLSGSLLQRIAERLYGLAFHNVPAVFFQNRDDRDFFLKKNLVREEQARVLPGSGIDLVRFSPVPLQPCAKRFTFVLIGRLLRDKGILEYVEAARMIRDKHPSARFQLLGAPDAANRSAINARTVKEWVEEGIVEHLGVTADVRPFIAAADCVILPSYREGTPRTLLEAAAMARPVIATDVPGCRQVIDDEVNGLLCKAGDAESLRDAILKFIALPQEAREQMGRNGRKKMEREYDHAFVIKAYINALADLRYAPGRRGRQDVPKHASTLQATNSLLKE